MMEKNSLLLCDQTEAVMWLLRAPEDEIQFLAEGKTEENLMRSVKIEICDKQNVAEMSISSCVAVGTKR